MNLENIIVIGMPEEIKIEQFDLINKHIKELSTKKIKTNSKIKKIYPNIKATKRKIIISPENFLLSHYSNSIKYKVRDFDENAGFSFDFYIADKTFEYKI
jgi:hypothetical protein